MTSCLLVRVLGIRVVKSSSRPAVKSSSRQVIKAPFSSLMSVQSNHDSRYCSRIGLRFRADQMQARLHRVVYAQSQVVGAEYFSTLACLGGGTIARQTVTKVGTAARSRVRVSTSKCATCNVYNLSTKIGARSTRAIVFFSQLSSFSSSAPIQLELCTALILII